MPLKKFKPVTSTSRYKTVSDFNEITKDTPCKKLLGGKSTRSSGRGFNGRISVRRRGGGHKRRYRIIDFKRNKYDIEGKVEAIEYDPNRSARIALICYSDGERRYIICPDKLKIGDNVVSSKLKTTKIRPGNSLLLSNIPEGTNIHNIEIKPDSGGKIIRSAGSYAQIVAKEGNYCQVKLTSGEMRKFHKNCRATIGQVGNVDHEKISLGKAGRARWMGRRPKVRGVVMNPIDHPMGGGEGKSSGGRHPVSPTGIPAKGFRTRKKKKYSDKLIVNNRRNKKR